MSAAARRRCDHEAAPVVAQPHAFDGHVLPLLPLLHIHDGIAGAHRLQSIRGIHITPGFDRPLRGAGGIELPVEGGHRLRLAPRPHEHRLWRGFVRVADLENAPFALRPIAPVRLAGVRADHEIALRRDRAIDEQQRHAADELRARDISGSRFRERGAPEFAARLADGEGIVRPSLRAETPAARARAIEAETARALMLRAVVHHARFIDHVRQPARVPRREAVVPPTREIDVEQFVERIAIRHPGRAFLIAGEEVAVPVELQRHDVTQARRELLDFAIRADAQQTAAALVGRVVRDAFFVVPIRVVVTRVAHRHVERAVGAERERHRAIHAAVVEIGRLHEFGIVEAFRHRLACVRHAVAIRVAPAHHFIGQHGVRHPVLHRHAERVVRARLGREGVHLVLQPIAIGVAEQMKTPIVTAGEKPPVRRVFDVVQAGQFHR